MKSISLLTLIASFLLFSSCEPDSSSLPSKTINQDDTAMLFFLLFKKEKKIELWKANQEFEHSLIADYSIIECSQTPLGIFNTYYSFGDKIRIDYPNNFYSQKASNPEVQEPKIFINSEFTGKNDHQSILVSKQTLALLQDALNTDIKTRAFVFPNDTRNGGEFEPCFGCPHYIGELYSSLELHLKKFSQDIR